MNERLHEWWGFRLRLPPDSDLKPLTRPECVLASMLGSSCALSIRLLYLALTPEPATRSAVGMVTEAGWSALVVFFFLAVGFFAPYSWFNRVQAGPWIVLSREKGSLAPIDVRFIVLAIILLILGAFRLNAPGVITALILLLSLMSVWIAMASQEVIRLTARRWRFVLPDWLRDRGARGPDEDTATVVPPDAGANPLYNLDCSGTSYRVGIKVSEPLLARLRELNAGGQGALYQTLPNSVVLMDRPPVDGDGPEHMVRLARQIASVARHHALTRYQIANLVLGFVQEGITYRFDDESTRGFPGGPFVEYGRFPVETLHDGVGDCECTALLCASLLSFLGFRAALIYVSIREEDSENECGHLAVGVDVEDLEDYAPTAASDVIESLDGSKRRFLYGETAVDGMRIVFGAIPGGWKTRLKVKGVQPVAKPAYPHAD